MPHAHQKAAEQQDLARQVGQMVTASKLENQHETYERAVESRDGAAHAHRVAEHQGKLEHGTGHGHSRQPLEHSPDHRQHTRPGTGSGATAFGRAAMAALAYELWQARGRPEGSSQEDWFRAAEELRSRAYFR
jgi:hypothetical protein